MNEHEIWNELGNLYYLSGAYEQAVHAYNRAIQLNNEFSKPHSNLALIYAKQRNYGDAIQLYKKSLSLMTEDEEKSKLWYRLGNVYRDLRDYEEAVAAYQNADELRSSTEQDNLEPTDQMVYVSYDSEVLPYETANELQHEVRDGFLTPEQESKSDLDQEFSTNELSTPKQESSLVVENRGNDQSTSTNKIQAISDALLEEAVSITSEIGEKRFSILIGNGDTEECFEYSPESNIINVKDEYVWTEENRIKEVAPTQDNAELLAAPPDEEVTENVSAENFLVDTESESSVQDEAQEDETPENVNEPVTPIARVEPEDGIQSESIVDISSQENEKEIEAEEEKLTRQIEINPRSAATWEALGTLYKTANRYEAAVQAYKQAISIAPSTVSYYHNLGLVYSAQGKNEDAFNTFQKVLELDPDHSLTHASLGGYYKKLGLDELAQKHIGKAMKNIYESENEYNRACLDAICGNTDRAIELLRIALEKKQTFINWVLNDPDLDSLREDERFKQLISEFNI